MRRMTVAAAIRRVGEVAVIGGAALVLVWAGARYTGQSGSSAVGRQLDGSVGIDFDASARTLVLFLRSDCVFCRTSMSFYRQLASANAVGVRIVVAAPAADTGIRRYLVSENLEPDAVVFAEEGELPVFGTPTLFMVDAKGVVMRSWVGRLDADGEAEVLRVLFG